MRNGGFSQYGFDSDSPMHENRQAEIEISDFTLAGVSVSRNQSSKSNITTGNARRSEANNGLISNPLGSFINTQADDSGQYLKKDTALSGRSAPINVMIDPQDPKTGSSATKADQQTEWSGRRMDKKLSSFQEKPKIQPNSDMAAPEGISSASNPATDRHSEKKEHGPERQPRFADLYAKICELINHLENKNIDGGNEFETVEAVQSRLEPLLARLESLHTENEGDQREPLQAILSQLRGKIDTLTAYDPNTQLQAALDAKLPNIQLISRIDRNVAALSAGEQTRDRDEQLERRFSGIAEALNRIERSEVEFSNRHHRDMAKVTSRLERFESELMQLTQAYKRKAFTAQHEGATSADERDQGEILARLLAEFADGLSELTGRVTALPLQNLSNEIEMLRQELGQNSLYLPENSDAATQNIFQSMAALNQNITQLSQKIDRLGDMSSGLGSGQRQSEAGKQAISPMAVKSDDEAFAELQSDLQQLIDAVNMRPDSEPEKNGGDKDIDWSPKKQAELIAAARKIAADHPGAEQSQDDARHSASRQEQKFEGASEKKSRRRRLWPWILLFGALAGTIWVLSGRPGWIEGELSLPHLLQRFQQSSAIDPMLIPPHIATDQLPSAAQKKDSANPQIPLIVYSN